MKKILLVAGFIVWAFGAGAQDARTDSAIHLIKQLAERYRRSPNIAFDLEYRYAAEDQPGKYLDSLKGSVKMSGSRYWYLLDGTEMICGDKYIVILFRDDKIMYLGKPSDRVASGNPVALLDSLLSKATGLRYSLRSSGNQQVVSIAYEKPGPYKSIDYYIDGASGLLTKMVSIVGAEQLYDPAVRSRLSDTKTFAVIETWFKNYSERGFDETVFDTNRYFKKEGKEYTTVAPYTIYKIFLGNPAL